MNKYIKSTFIFIGIWFTASLLNGLLSGIAILLEGNWMNEGSGYLILSIIFSFVFSVPLVGLVWLITLLAQASDKKGNDLLQIVLGTALFCGAAGGMFFIYAFETECRNARYFIALSIIISALAAVLFFRKQIKTNG
jgi:hypothetical protein